MGSAASKAARDQVRRYPRTHKPVGTQTLPEGQARRSERNPVKEDGISTDIDTHSDSFSQRLQQMGVVQPNPTFSPSSTASHQFPHAGRPDAARPSSNSAFQASPILSTFEARDRLQRQAEAEFNSIGSAHAQGRRFADMRHLLDAIRMRGGGASLPDIERHLGLSAGLLEKLGRPGIISHVSS